MTKTNKGQESLPEEGVESVAAGGLSSPRSKEVPQATCTSYAILLRGKNSSRDSSDRLRGVSVTKRSRRVSVLVVDSGICVSRVVGTLLGPDRR